MQRLAIITTHPIQYHAPLFRLLKERGVIEIKVFYTWSQLEKGSKYDPGFGKEVEWDIPLLEGYDYEFVENRSKKPGSSHFFGMVNPGLIAAIESWKPSAILVMGWAFRSHLQCMRHFHGKIPVLFRGDSTLMDEKPGIKKIVRRLFLKWVYRHIDIALFTGTANKDYFSVHGIADEKLLHVPHSVHNERFYSTANDKVTGAVSERKALGISESDLVILFAGKLEAKKDPVFLVKSFLKISNSHLKLLMVGNGNLEKELKELALADKRILFLDFQNQSRMPVIYTMADIFVLPSAGPGETWGLAVNEAMACGKPVLVSNKCGCAADLVINGENGFVFESGNESDLIGKINELCKEKNALIQMGVRSKEIIAEWNYDRVAKCLEGLLRKEN